VRGRQPLREEPPDQIPVIAERAPVHPAAEQQQARVLDPAAGEHDQPGPDEAARAVRAPNLHTIHPARIVVGVQQACRPRVVTWREPVPGRPSERPDARLVEPMDRIAHALATVQPLGAALHIASAALEYADADVGTQHLVGDADCCRPCPDNADIGVYLLAARKVRRVRQHQLCTPSMHRGRSVTFARRELTMWSMPDAAAGATMARPCRRLALIGQGGPGGDRKNG
jgi:hypothetical protein